MTTPPLRALVVLAVLVHRLGREDFPRSGARVAADGRIEVPTRVAGSDQPAPPAAPR